MWLLATAAPPIQCTIRRNASSETADTHVVLGLLLVPLLLSTTKGALKVLGLDVNLAELLSGLLEVLLGLVELLLQKLHLASEVLASGAMGVALIGNTLELLDLALGLVKLLLGEAELVLQRRDLLVTLKERLVKLVTASARGGQDAARPACTHLFVLGLGLLGARLGCLNLLAEKGKALLGWLVQAT